MTDGYTKEQTDIKVEIVIKIDFDFEITIFCFRYVGFLDRYSCMGLQIEEIFQHYTQKVE